MILSQFLGISDLPTNGQKLAKTFLYLVLLANFFGNFGGAFSLLYYIDNIGFAHTGIVFSIILFVQFIFDYPSGALGDRIGQRWVLALAYFVHALSFLLLSVTTNFAGFILIGILQGFASAQQSGALFSWFDNNYEKQIGKLDDEKKIYGFFMSRSRSFMWISEAISLAAGGMFATIFSRVFTFQIIALMYFFFIIVILSLVKDVKSDDTFYQPLSFNKTKKSYFRLFKEGLSYVLKTRSVFFFIVGQALVISSFQVFFILINLPMIFGYSGSDQITGFVRSLLSLALFVSSFVVAYFSKKALKKHMPILMFIYVFLYFTGLIMIIIVFPMENTLNLMPIVLMILIMISIDGIIGEIGVILLQRVQIDLIPSDMRNSIYSLSPSLIAILGVFLLPLIGLIVENYDLLVGLIIIEIISLIGSIFLFFVVKSTVKDTLPNIKDNIIVN
jgi:MFS family permease